MRKGVGVVKPKFEVKNEHVKMAYIQSFRIRPEVHAIITQISKQSNQPIQEVVRQMIDFAIEHIEPKPDRQGGSR